MFLNHPIAAFGKAKAYRTLCGVLLFFVSLPAASQVQRGNCGNPDPDVSIAGCTKKIQSDTADLESVRGNALAATAKLATDYNNRGIAYASKGLYDQAIADYNQAISLVPKTFPVAYFNRGSAYEHRGAIDAAIADYRAALKLDPEVQSAKDAWARLGGGP